MKIIRKTAIVMLLCLYFLTYGVLPQVQAAGKDAPVIVVAHRAGAKVAPENTVVALEQAIRDGAPIAEIDVQQLSDGTLIVMHDSNFKRTTGEDICVWDVEADALKTLEVGSGFSAAYRGEQIPTLEEMLACARGRITLMIELKYTGQEDALEESVLDEASYFGRIFARCGGLAEAVEQGIKEHGNIDFKLKAASCDGIEQCRIALLKKSKNLLDANFIEGMACTGGCIGGAGCLTHGPRSRAEVDKYGMEANEKTISDALAALEQKPQP